MTKTNQNLSPATVRVMATGCGLAAANLYYNQPLLGEFQKAFSVDAGQTGWVPTVTQLGYACGMLVLVPLGDQRERRSLIVTMMVLSGIMLVLCGLAQNLVWLVVASFLVGITSVAPQLLIPFAAHLAPTQKRGQILGTVMSGLLVGILLARTVSGFVGASFGWRAMFFLAAAVMFAFAWILRRNLPQSTPTFSGTYFGLLRSLASLVRTQPTLRQAAFLGAMLFGSFSAFWATLSYLLSEVPFQYGPRASGLFGLLGAAGAVAAPLVGRVADRRNPKAAIVVGVGIAALSYLTFLVSSESLFGIIVGVLLLDVGVQGGHVANQSRVFALLPEARSRLNTVYMFVYFLGGALGSALGSWGWIRAGWTGVSLVGLSMLALAGLCLLLPVSAPALAPERVPG